MIEVAELSGAQVPKSDSELYELVLGMVGSTIRIRQGQIESVPVRFNAEDRIHELDALKLRELTGRLISVEAFETRVKGFTGSPKIEIGVSIEGSEERVALRIEGIELQLQARLSDPIGWRIIHQSAGWSGLEAWSEGNAA